ncbi:unnamed protein product [Effrenium voratum]|nr:unnamed protein product [Effrenium voratum]|mmetsp:Transcript_68743/g.163743  ORF Transcript_68743/g.163743 Transcript_68743/m.163743 type:complete len:314 (-) Transcript_68743:266-1207(-)
MAMAMEKVPTGPSVCLSADSTCEGPSSEEENVKLPQQSVGAVLHGTGECRPCAWFWKPQGCRNGKECLHCHLCLSNEIKIRKKKNWLQHKGGEKQAEKVPDVQASQIVRSTLGLGPPPGLAASGPMWIAPGDSDLGEGARGPSYVGPGEVRRELQDFQDGQGLSGLMTRAGEIEFGRDYLQALFSDDAVTDGRVPWPPTPLPSRGSAKHSAGECRPCAWFWKKGCLNGELCQHCHLCPEGEIRRKKKAKNEGRDKYNIDMPLRPANSFDQGCSVWKLPDAAASSTIFDLPFGHGPGLRIDRPTFSIADAASAV